MDSLLVVYNVANVLNWFDITILRKAEYEKAIQETKCFFGWVE